MNDIIEQLRRRESETCKRIDEFAAMLDELTELKNEHRKIKKAIAVLEGTRATPAGPGVTGQVLGLLRDTDHPLRVLEIAEMLDLDVTQARSAGGYLSRKGEVRNVQRGVWAAAVPGDTY